MATKFQILNRTVWITLDNNPIKKDDLICYYNFKESGIILGEILKDDKDEFISVLNLEDAKQKLTDYLKDVIQPDNLRFYKEGENLD